MIGSSPLVSIILPTYNRAGLLPKAIYSAISQTYDNWELIIWNDGSQDGTEEVIKSYRDPRIRHFREHNCGMSHALNSAIRRAQGDYLAFLDDDDQWVESKLSRQVGFLERDPATDLIFGNFWNVNLATGEKGIGFEQLSGAMGNLEVEDAGDACFRVVGNFLRSICLDNFIASDTVVVRKATVEKVGGFNENLRNGMDFEYWWRLGLDGGRLAYTIDIVLIREKQPDSLSGRGILACENVIKCLDSCAEQAARVSRDDLVSYLRPQYRNVLQNMIPLHGRNGDRKAMLGAFLESTRYGFKLGSVRLLLQALLASAGRRQVVR